jgi:hypothetical protein
MEIRFMGFYSTPSNTSVVIRPTLWRAPCLSKVPHPLFSRSTPGYNATMADKRFIVLLKDGGTQPIIAESGDEDEQENGYVFFPVVE